MNSRDLKIEVARYIQDRIHRQILNPDAVVSSRYNIPETLLQLDILTIEADGSDRSMLDIYNELTELIAKMEG